MPRPSRTQWPDGARNEGEAALYSAMTPEAVRAAYDRFPEYLASDAMRRGATPRESSARCSYCFERAIYAGRCTRCQAARNRTGNGYRSSVSALPETPEGWLLWSRAQVSSHVASARYRLGAWIAGVKNDDW